MGNYVKIFYEAIIKIKKNNLTITMRDSILKISVIIDSYFMRLLGLKMQYERDIWLIKFEKITAGNKL